MAANCIESFSAGEAAERVVVRHSPSVIEHVLSKVVDQGRGYNTGVHAFVVNQHDCTHGPHIAHLLVHCFSMFKHLSTLCRHTRTVEFGSFQMALACIGPLTIGCPSVRHS